MNYYEDFKKISETGKKILVMKATEKCSCGDLDGIFENQYNPHCKKCYGTGYERFEYLTEKIRYADFEKIETSNELPSEKTDFKNFKSDDMVFFMHEKYNNINNKDILVILKHKKNKMIFPLNKKQYFKVVDIKTRQKDDFVFYRVIGRKMKYLGGIK